MTLAARRWAVLQILRFQRCFSIDLARALLSLASGTAQPSSKSRQLLVDVSIINKNDAGTGIQRVVRAVLKQLLMHPPAGYDVRPICASRSHGYQYAERYRSHLLGQRPTDSSAPVRIESGDLFLALDFTAHAMPYHHWQLSRWKAKGARMFFVVYDLLPALHPEWFSKGLVKAYRAWLRCMSVYADGAICISESVSTELHAYLEGKYLPIDNFMEISWFHLGADIKASVPKLANETEVDLAVISRLRKSPSILMIGTIEPRKGYAQALSAFEILWREGRQVNLVIVGKTGWKVVDLIRRLRGHAEVGRRLYWFENASDQLLGSLYQNASGLLMASEGEGFGLPIIEIAQHGKPILARDLPVFREVAGDNARYFSGTRGDVLAAELGVWLDLMRANQAISSERINPLTWEVSAQQLLNCLKLMR